MCSRKRGREPPGVCRTAGVDGGGGGGAVQRAVCAAGAPGGDGWPHAAGLHRVQGRGHRTRRHGRSDHRRGDGRHPFHCASMLCAAVARPAGGVWRPEAHEVLPQDACQPIDFTPQLFAQHRPPHMDAARIIEVPTFNRAVDEYFAHVAGLKVEKQEKQVRASPRAGGC